MTRPEKIDLELLREDYEKEVATRKALKECEGWTDEQLDDFFFVVSLYAKRQADAETKAQKYIAKYHKSIVAALDRV